MLFWSLEVYAGFIVLRGSLPIDKLRTIIEEFCGYDWIVDMQWAKEIDAAFVICDPKLAKEWKKDADNK